MKTICLTLIRAILLIIWIIMTVVLTCSIIGNVVFIPKNEWKHAPDDPATWFVIGEKLINSIIDA